MGSLVKIHQDKRILLKTTSDHIKLTLYLVSHVSWELACVQGFNVVVKADVVVSSQVYFANLSYHMLCVYSKYSYFLRILFFLLYSKCFLVVT